jgi:hypothetical protein
MRTFSDGARVATKRPRGLLCAAHGPGAITHASKLLVSKIVATLAVALISFKKLT